MSSFLLLQQFIKNEATSISLAVDIWTAKNRHDYLGINCSFLDQKFELHEITLDIADITYFRTPYTSEHILAALDDVLSRWKIRCIEHTLHLIIKKAIKPAEILISRAKNYEDLLKKEGFLENSTKLLYIIMNFPTSWKSFSYVAKKYKKIGLTEDEQNLIRDLKSILCPFLEIAKLLREGNHYTYSLINPALLEIKNKFYLENMNTVEINFEDEELTFDKRIQIDEPIRNRQSQRITSSILANLKKPSSPVCSDEVTEYLPLEEIDLESNPFMWWKERKENFLFYTLLL
ncbi:unnamed protein product [Rhizophagus irregularis]|nr:unnamed protein product [Rhizophagus irregularis]